MLAVVRPTLENVLGFRASVRVPGDASADSAESTGASA